MTYEEVLAQYPDWLVIDTDVYWKEETLEVTEQSRLRVKWTMGIYLKFMQDNGLVRRQLFSGAPELPDHFKVHLRDLTPEGYEFHRTGFAKWRDYLDRENADPTNIRAMEKALAKLRGLRSSSS